VESCAGTIAAIPSEQSVCRLRADRFSGETRNRTEDTTIFSRMLYQLSYLAGTNDPSVSAGVGPLRRGLLGRLEGRSWSPEFVTMIEAAIWVLEEEYNRPMRAREIWTLIESCELYSRSRGKTYRRPAGLERSVAPSPRLSCCASRKGSRIVGLRSSAHRSPSSARRWLSGRWPGQPRGLGAALRGRERDSNLGHPSRRASSQRPDPIASCGPSPSARRSAGVGWSARLGGEHGVQDG
jgi:HB1, ASXL, restriction endonuclease HTH domain